MFAGLQQGSVYIDTSTNAPATMRRIAEIGISKGFHVLDAPVSGGVVGAREATLTVFVGGDKKDFERLQPLMKCMGRNVVYMGAAGSGNVTKLVNNVMMYINFVGACEGMAMAVKAGIDPQTLLDVINTSLGQSIILERNMGLFLKGEHWDFATELAVKDMRLGVQLGGETGVPMEISSRVERVITRFRDEVGPGKDFLEFMRDFMQRSGVELPGRP